MHMHFEWVHVVARVHATIYVKSDVSVYLD